MTDKTTLVDEATLYDFAEALFVAAGFSLEEATYTAQSLVLSDLLGLHSHGVLRVPAYVYGLSKGHITAKHDLTIEKESDNTLHANGNQVLGQVQMRRLLDKLYTKAETQGVVSAAMHNSGHIGRVGEWVERATEKALPSSLAVMIMALELWLLWVVKRPVLARIPWPLVCPMGMLRLSLISQPVRWQWVRYGLPI